MHNGVEEKEFRIPENNILLLKFPRKFYYIIFLGGSYNKIYYQ